ncbi:hypothetical protein FDECE_8425 [Fusarium decemcellulare]|nr:hypothetical protein FDECE_8425 [Fusarium decemcellulare]
MPARSTNITIINETSLDLNIEVSELSHGIWSDGLGPVLTISSQDQGNMEAESDGIMTGDEGELRYSSSAGTFHFMFDNPWHGSNSYDEKAPSGYTITRSGGGGDNASVTWTIGVTVIVYDEDVDSFKSLPNTSVLIAGDTIAAIFPTDEDEIIPDDAERVDARGKIVSPSFVDTHHHGWQTAYKTLAADSHIAEFFYEMLDAGTTSVLEHAMASFNQETADAYLRGSLETGLRAWFAFAIQDYSRSRKDFPGMMEQINMFNELRKEPKLADSNVYLGIGYDGWRFESETTHAVVNLIRSGDAAVVTSHFSGPYYTMSTLGRLDRLGAFDNSKTPFVLSHASLDVFDETQLMRQKDVYISTTP